MLCLATATDIIKWVKTTYILTISSKQYVNVANLVLILTSMFLVWGTNKKADNYRRD